MQLNKNNFGFMRLLLAILVIVSHTPEILDQNRNREILTNIFGTISFGELAIDGFFLISGYLILKSYLTSKNISSYLFKRFIRIYPGFIVASIFCIFVLLPLSGEINLLLNTNLNDWIRTIFRMLTLEAPSVKNTQYASLNGSMWSIWLEFVCYLCIPIVCAFKFNKLKIFVVLASLMLAVFIFTLIFNKNIWLPYVRLDLHHSSRLMFAFLIGGIFFLMKDKLIWNKYISICCFVLLIILMNYKGTAELALIILGGYLLFNFSLNYKNNFLNSIGSKVDVSYGVYLYAWPVQIYLIKFYPQVDLYFLIIFTITLALMFGYLSWRFVEKPFMQLKKKMDA